MSRDLLIVIAIILLTLGSCRFFEAQAGPSPEGCQICPRQCYGPNPSVCGSGQYIDRSSHQKHYQPFSRRIPVGPCQPRLVPVTYREEGPIRSIVINAVGLLASTIQLPFRAIEAILPVTWSRQQAVVPNYNGPQSPCAGNTPILRRPQPTPIPPCGHHAAICAPPSPDLGPIPSQPTTPACGTQLPPQLVRESNYPSLEPADLLQGVLRLPQTIIQSGRWFGDMSSTNPGNPYPYGQQTRP
ncbi:MAG: hypothetical protein ACP5VS_04740 [Desulfomonilaceae bacterium]